MHVGHIRSTGIGDALQRTLRLLGHDVKSDNHIGDWGTQFGYILLVGWKQIYLDHAPVALKRYLDSDPIGTMGTFYQYGRVAGQINDYRRISLTTKVMRPRSRYESNHS